MGPQYCPFPLVRQGQVPICQAVYLHMPWLAPNCRTVLMLMDLHLSREHDPGSDLAELAVLNLYLIMNQVFIQH